MIARISLALLHWFVWLRRFSRDWRRRGGPRPWGLLNQKRMKAAPTIKPGCPKLISWTASLSLDSPASGWQPPLPVLKQLFRKAASWDLLSAMGWQLMSPLSKLLGWQTHSKSPALPSLHAGGRLLLSILQVGNLLLLESNNVSSNLSREAVAIWAQNRVAGGGVQGFNSL